MTQNRRIVLNIVATYGIPRASIHRRNAAPQGPLWVVRAAKQALCGVRSLYALVIGLFCGWRMVMG